VTLITRYGVGKVCYRVSLKGPLTRSVTSIQIEGHLSGHIASVQQSGHPVVWVCDPMHGK